jgi:hypothetical protein
MADQAGVNGWQSAEQAAQYDKHIYLRPGCQSLINHSLSITELRLDTFDQHQPWS